MIWKVGFVLFIFLLDLASKFWTQSHIPLMYASAPVYPYGGIGIFKDFFGVEFSLVHATNTGAAWSLFSDHASGLLILRLILITGLIFFLFKEKSPYLKLPIGLIIAGALGNILDIFFYGHVIDMFYFVFWGYSYPVFNVADSAICLGVFLYILNSWKYADDPQAAAK
jgi:signal peptidase II